MFLVLADFGFLIKRYLIEIRQKMKMPKIIKNMKHIAVIKNDQPIILIEDLKSEWPLHKINCLVKDGSRRKLSKRFYEN